MDSDSDIVASRATEPTWFSSPYPEWSGVVPSPYQDAAVEYRIRRRHALFGDEPGLGKSCESLLYGNAIQAEYTLIICPASLRLNWVREIRMWSNIEGASIYPVLRSRDGVSLEHNFVVISYDLVKHPGVYQALLDERWDHLILDEAHAIKDPKGNARSAAICGGVSKGTEYYGLANVTDRISLLSGTILPNQPIECYNAVRLMDWDAIDCMSVDAFRDYYYEEGPGWVRGPVLKEYDDDGYRCEPYYVHELHYSQTVKNRPVNLRELQYRLRKNVMVRRKKSAVLDQLPPKEWHPVPVSSSSAVRKALKNRAWEQVERLHESGDDVFNRGIPVDGEIATAMRQLGEAKAPLVADYIEDLLDSGVHKILVGAWHRNTLDEEGCGNSGLSVLHYLRKRLSRYGLVYMDGTTSTKAKQEAVDRFQRDSETRVILGQLATIGEGWTLTEAQDCVFAEFYWVPGKNDQLLDRIHRRGQEGEYVIGHVPFVPGTIDERVIGTAIWKDKNIYEALDAA